MKRHTTTLRNVKLQLYEMSNYNFMKRQTTTLRNVKLQLCNTLIRPTLTYASET